MGVDLERFDEKPDDSLLCGICSKVLEEPVIGECGHGFCATCLQKQKTSLYSTSPKCLKCVSSSDEHEKTTTRPLETVVNKGDRDVSTSVPAAKEQEESPRDIDSAAGPLAPGKAESSEQQQEHERQMSELLEKLGRLAIHCPRQRSMGCSAVVSYHLLRVHVDEECEFRPVRCGNKGCPHEAPAREMESHQSLQCDYRTVECEVCKSRLPRKDLAAHNAVKRCFEQLNKRRRVKSARKLSQELQDHRKELVHQRHLTEQAERQILREHYEEKISPQRKMPRPQSAGPVLVRTSVQARVGSATVMPHYSRNLRSAALDSCRDCSNKFLSGRRPSARRHSHIKVQTSTINICINRTSSLST